MLEAGNMEVVNNCLKALTPTDKAKMRTDHTQTEEMVIMKSTNHKINLEIKPPRDMVVLREIQAMDTPTLTSEEMTDTAHMTEILMMNTAPMIGVRALAMVPMTEV